MSTTETGDIRTDNDFLIGTDGQSVGPPMFSMHITSREQAYRTAAWIELMGAVLPCEDGGVGRDDGPTFEQVRDAIRNT